MKKPVRLPSNSNDAAFHELHKFTDALARLAYLEGDSAPLAALARSGEMLDATREFVARIIEGKIKKCKGPKDKTYANAVRDSQIKREYRDYYEKHKQEIAAEKQAAATKRYNKREGSAKERALCSVGNKHGLSSERISEIVYPRKREKP